MCDGIALARQLKKHGYHIGFRAAPHLVRVRLFKSALFFPLSRSGAAYCGRVTYHYVAWGSIVWRGRAVKVR
jgi:hypothetical protein